MIIPKRITARMNQSFCVFLIGMRINRAWKLAKWLPVFFAMPRMLDELRRRPELGFLGGHLWFGRTTLVLQYWQSFEALTSYARQADLAHLPAWGRFRQTVGDSGDVGIWHETYLISERRIRKHLSQHASLRTRTSWPARRSYRISEYGVWAAPVKVIEMKKTFCRSAGGQRKNRNGSHGRHGGHGVASKTGLETGIKRFING